MENQAIRRNPTTDPVDYRNITEWLAEAGVTVDRVEAGPAHSCPTCRPRDLHAAA